MCARLSWFILKLLGWKIDLHYDIHTVPQAIEVVMQHTSNYDFPLGLLLRSALKWDVKFAAKHTLFHGLSGWIFKKLGGYPVDRSRRLHHTEAVAELFAHEPRFHISISPEGTRSKVDNLKSGFYYIAKEADIPIILVSFDYGTKTFFIREPIKVDMSYEELLHIMADFFEGKHGYHRDKEFNFKHYFEHAT